MRTRGVTLAGDFMLVLPLVELCEMRVVGGVGGFCRERESLSEMKDEVEDTHEYLPQMR